MDIKLTSAITVELTQWMGGGRGNGGRCNMPRCDECGRTAFFWHCREGVGLATCLSCKVLNDFRRDDERDHVDEHAGRGAGAGDGQ